MAILWSFKACCGCIAHNLSLIRGRLQIVSGEKGFEGGGHPMTSVVYGLPAVLVEVVPSPA